MFFSKIFSLGALASLAAALPLEVRSAAPSGNTGGGVTIVNNVDRDLYLWSVSNDVRNMVTLNPGGTYVEDWRINPNGGGISIKISTEPNQDKVLQFEYTLASPKIFWDLSCIDMSERSFFSEVGFAVTTSGDQCENAVCEPGDFACSAAYLVPTDDHATHGCPQDTQMVLDIGSPSGSSSSSSSTSSAVPSVTASPSVANKAANVAASNTETTPTPTPSYLPNRKPISS
ncbi:hypothetical protein VTN31DRAFT_3996 [Thermomyces dupontii]|uniref:uncharacterized protein n=1 Tax=Talaromyces thermophilus TaxID=28565 RepID=UPI0037422463